ncbi:MAG TPA: hypothetical protein VF576_07870 [Rubricoccaceae bacterium]|jgi:hypothetical protein
MTPEPVTCTLTADEFRLGAADLLPGLIAEAHAVEWLPDGVCLTFEAADGLLARVASVVDRERRCCRFFRFVLDVEPGLGPVRLAVTGPPGTRDVLESLASPLPETP